MSIRDGARLYVEGDLSRGCYNYHVETVQSDFSCVNELR